MKISGLYRYAMHKHRIIRFLISVIAIWVSALCNIAYCADNTLKASSAEIENSNRIFRESLQKLPTDSLFNKGTRYIIRQPVAPDSAMLCFITATSRADYLRNDTASMKAIAKSLINTAHVYSSFFKDPAQAYSYLLKARQMCLEYGFDSILAHVYLNTSYCYHSNKVKNSTSMPGNESHEGTRYLKEAFDIAEKSGNHEVMAYAIYNLTNELQPHNTDSMKTYLKRYLSADIPDSEKTKQYVTTLSKGMIEYIDGRYAKAREYFMRLDSIKVPLQLTEKQMSEYGHLMASFTYEMGGDFHKAAEIQKQLLKAARERDDLESEMSMNGNLYLLFSRHGQTELADRYLLDYYKTREKLATASGNDESMEEIELRDDLDNYEKELQLARIRENRNRILFIASAAVGLCIIIILMVVLYFSRKRRRYINSLYEKHIQLTESRNRSNTTTDNMTDDVAADTGSVISYPSPADSAEKRGTSLPADIPTPAEKDLAEKIAEILNHSPMVFDPDFQMARLCAEVGSNVTYVSKAVNTHFGKPFKTVVTERRIAEACRRFDNPEDNSLYTVEAICTEVGFKSRAAFSVAFKNITGLTPTEYRNAARRYMPPK